jgi:hypothetical protein
MARDPRLARAGVNGFNKPKKTPGHPTKSHVVVAKQGDKIKTIRFGQQGVKGAGKNPKSAKDKARKKAITLVTTPKMQVPVSYLRVIGRIRLNGKAYESTST